TSRILSKRSSYRLVIISKNIASWRVGHHVMDLSLSEFTLRCLCFLFEDHSYCEVIDISEKHLHREFHKSYPIKTFIISSRHHIENYCLLESRSSRDGSFTERIHLKVPLFLIRGPLLLRSD